jgi:tripartite-type tricarboxylate transporter receptor subunit TctC
MKTTLRLLICFALAIPGISISQSYPAKPVRMIVTFAAGGGTDLVARAVSPKLSELLGQPVVVENRAGANGAVGADAVAKAPADGYTLCVCAAGTMVVGPHLTKQPFDTFRDFAPVSLLATNPFVVTVNPALKVSSVRELIELAKANPGKVNYGSSGIGGAPHLSTELFKHMAGVNMVHVAYKGLGPAITDLLGGQIQVIFADVGLVKSHVKSGKLRGLAVTSAERSAAVPDLPTVAEAGVPGYASGTWYGVLAPAGTPAAVLARLSADIGKVLGMPEIGSALVAQGVEPAPMTPQQYGGFIRAEYAKWGKVIRDAGIKLE